MNTPLGVASCTRVSMPSSPATMKKKNAVTIMRRPMTEWLTEARRCSPVPLAQIADSSRCRRSARPRRRRIGGRAHCLPPQAARPRKRRGVIGLRMHDDVEAHAGVPLAAELGALALIAPGRVGLQAQVLDASGDGVDLAGQARDPQRVDDVATGDHDVHRHAGGQVQHAFGGEPALVGIAEDPAPALGLHLDARRAHAGQRQQALAGDQAIADERDQHQGRQHQPAEHDPALRRHQTCPSRGAARPCANEHHDQREQRDRAGEHDPPQPRDRRRRRAATGRAWTAARCSRPAPPAPSAGRDRAGWRDYDAPRRSGQQESSDGEIEEGCRAARLQSPVMLEMRGSTSVRRWRWSGIRFTS